MERPRQEDYRVHIWIVMDSKQWSPTVPANLEAGSEKRHDRQSKVWERNQRTKKELKKKKKTKIPTKPREEK